MTQQQSEERGQGGGNGGLLGRAASEPLSDTRIVGDLSRIVFPFHHGPWTERQLAATRTLLLAMATSLVADIGGGGGVQPRHPGPAEEAALADPALVGFASAEALLAELDRDVRSRDDAPPVAMRAAQLVDHRQPAIADAALAWFGAELAAVREARPWRLLPARLLHRLAGIVITWPGTDAGRALAELLAGHDESGIPAVARRRLAHLLDSAGEAAMLRDAPLADVGVPLWFALLAQASGLDSGTLVRAASLGRTAQLAVICRACGMDSASAVASLRDLAGAANGDSLPSPQDFAAMSRDGARNLVARWRLALGTPEEQP